MVNIEKNDLIETILKKKKCFITYFLVFNRQAKSICMYLGQNNEDKEGMGVGVQD